MGISTQYVSVDITKKTAPQIIRLGQGDKNGTTIAASIYNDGAEYSMSGKTARFCMRTPDGKASYSVNSSSTSGNLVSFNINEQYAASVAGKTDVAYIEVLSGSTVICSTSRISVVVYRSASEGLPVSGAYSDALEEAIHSASTAASSANSAASNANTKATRAENAATAANNAAESVNTAKDAANAAASAATTAAGSANTAAEAANSAKDAANAAATAANTAAGNANTAADRANAAASEANAVIESNDVYESAQPNLTPWFSAGCNCPDAAGYWHTLALPDYTDGTEFSSSEGRKVITAMGDGWAHVIIDARPSAGNKNKSAYVNTHVNLGKLADIVPGGTYTWLAEVRNMTWIGATDSDKLIVAPSVGNATMDKLSTSSVTEMKTKADAVMRTTVVAKNDFSGVTRDTRGYMVIPRGCYAEFDVRVSLYKGEYAGPYKPFSDASLYRRVAILEAEDGAVDLETADGVLPVAHGGTGLTASPSALVDLASSAAASMMQASPRPGVTGTLPVAHGGTGATTAAAALTALGAAAASDMAVYEESSPWASIKFPSLGVRIAWANTVIQSATVTIVSQAYGGYRSDPYDVAIPSGWFTSAPSGSIFKNGSQAWRVNGGTMTTTKITSIYLASGAEESAKDFPLSIILVGKC